MKKIYFVLLSALLGGCSVTDTLKDSVRAVETQFTDADRLTEQLRTSQVNIVPLSNLPYRLLALETTNRVDITSESPAISLSQGNSFVAAFLLPERISRFTFNLESLIGRTVFVPSVLFLDENFEEVAHIDTYQFADSSLVMEQTFDDGIVSSNARYIIIYTKNSELDGQTELRDILREYEEKNGRVLSEASYPKPYAKHAPIGNINVTIKDVYFDAKKASNKVKKTVEQPTVSEEVKVVETVKPVSILSDTENYYLQMITDAINKGELTRAKSLTEEAVRAGSTKALPHYIEEIGKMK